MHIRTPTAEATAWKAEAAALGVTLTDLVRARMNDTAVTVVRVTDPSLVNEVRRIGNNLNQVVHGAHAGWPVTKAALDRVLDAVADVMRALLRELA